MELSGKLHAMPLYPRKRRSVTVEWVLWVLDPVWTFLRRQKSLAPIRIQILDCPISIPVIIPTTLPWLPLLRLYSFKWKNDSNVWFFAAPCNGLAGIL